MKFERECVQEIWRTSQCTFNVVYPTASTVCIKGMRGSLERKDFVALVGIFARANYKELLYERMNRDGELVECSIKIKEKHRNYLATTVSRDKLNAID